jgi:hypothetical protein
MIPYLLAIAGGYLIGNAKKFFSDGGDINDDEHPEFKGGWVGGSIEKEQELRNKMNISINTQNGKIYIGGLKPKNILYKDDNGFFLIDGYGKFMGKKYPVKKYFTDKLEIQIIEKVIK